MTHAADFTVRIAVMLVYGRWDSYKWFVKDAHNKPVYMTFDECKATIEEDLQEMQEALAESEDGTLEDEFRYIIVDREGKQKFFTSTLRLPGRVVPEGLMEDEETA